MGQSASNSTDRTEVKSTVVDETSNANTFLRQPPRVRGFRSQDIEKRIISDSIAASINDVLPAECHAGTGLQGAHWYLVFNSNIHGKSFKQMVDRICEKGPTVIAIKVKNSNRIIGAFCGADWLNVAAREKQATSQAAALRRAAREGQKSHGIKGRPENQNIVFFGGENCFLFTGNLGDMESCRIYRASPSTNSNFMYLFDSHPLEEKEGIGMGGQPGYFGWFVDKWLEYGYCYGANCTTFKCPRLSDDEKWEVDSIEAYAVKSSVVDALLKADFEIISRDSSLRTRQDSHGDRLLMELHGVHKFDAGERPDV